MGLDMYLTGRRYVWENNPDSTDSAITEALNKVPNLGHMGKRIKGIEVEAMYWRKANAIHKWFVDNVQDGVDECQEHYVSREKLYELRDACLEAKYDPDNAKKYLPTTAGFFFGSTDIDEYYFRGLEETINGLNECLGMDSQWSFYYCSSW
jgi:hypothetical protein